MPDAAEVLAAGLTSRREPASNSRRLIELPIDGHIEPVLTETLLDETRAVLLDPGFVARVSVDEAGGLLAGLTAVAVVIVRDRGLEAPRRAVDPYEDYSFDAALKSEAFLGSRDDHARWGDRQPREGGADRSRGLIVACSRW